MVLCSPSMRTSVSQAICDCSFLFNLPLLCRRNTISQPNIWNQWNANYAIDITKGFYKIIRFELIIPISYRTYWKEKALKRSQGWIIKAWLIRGLKLFFWIQQRIEKQASNSFSFKSSEWILNWNRKETFISLAKRTMTFDCHRYHSKQCFTFCWSKDAASPGAFACTRTRAACWRSPFSRHPLCERGQNQFLQPYFVLFNHATVAYIHEILRILFKEAAFNVKLSNFFSYPISRSININVHGIKLF